MGAVTEKKKTLKILLTAFEPFGGQTLNASLEAVKLVMSESCVLIKLVVPTEYDRCMEVVKEAVEREEPDIVLCIGEAGGRRSVSVERVAINCDDAELPDNAGAVYRDQPIVKGGPDAYFTPLPVRKMVKAIQEQGIPAEVSNTAGTYVCNHLFYSALHYISQKELNMQAGFIHLPRVPAQLGGQQAEQGDDAFAGMPAMTSAKALETVIDFLAHHYLENHVYIVRCADGSLYTGWTNDLLHRLETHNSGQGAKYTRSRMPVELVYYESYKTNEEAMRREIAIKRMPRAAKEKLIAEASEE